jgi:integrative and conjugative element protein (TIGR02256 family)
VRYTHRDGAIRLAAHCLETLEAHRQRTRFHRENGGQLFARYSDGVLVVEQATCVKGARSRFSFHPNRGEEQREIDALFEQGLHYVGDWHTHPEGRPTPSTPDRTKMLEIFQQSKHLLPYMLIVIVGLEPFPAGLFLGAVESGQIIELACCR